MFIKVENAYWVLDFLGDYENTKEEDFEFFKKLDENKGFKVESLEEFLDYYAKLQMLCERYDIVEKFYPLYAPDDPTIILNEI